MADSPELVNRYFIHNTDPQYLGDDQRIYPVSGEPVYDAIVSRLGELYIPDRREITHWSTPGSGHILRAELHRVGERKLILQKWTWLSPRKFGLAEEQLTGYDARQAHDAYDRQLCAEIPASDRWAESLVRLLLD